MKDWCRHPTHLAVKSSDDTEVQIITSIRSSAAEDTDKLRGKIISTAEIAGAKVETSGGYPAWEVKKIGTALYLARVFETMYGKKPEITPCMRVWKRPFLRIGIRRWIWSLDPICTKCTPRRNI